MKLKMNKTIIVTLFCAFFAIGRAQVVNTTYGAVRGTTLTSRNGREIVAFLGIPYGRETSGNQRFKAPEPPEKWTGVLDASSYGPVCPQLVFQIPILENDSTGSEDCLRINVFTPINANRTLPVLIYVHGGFFMGSAGSDYGPRYILDHDAILVTFNYRLGVFGFLATPDDDAENAPGNAGMKDQVLALKWVQEEIRNFGGDARRVTIYGESAGAAAVHYHLLSPLSKGLFSAAISGSGSAFKVLSHQVLPDEAAKKVASETGCGHTIGNATEMISCLRSVEASVIAANSDEFLEVLKDPLRIFSPSRESRASSDDTFISQHPYEIIVNGLQQTVPWMIGVNSGEGLLTTSSIYASEEWTREVNTNWNNGLASKFLIYNESNAQLTNSINEFYLNSNYANGTVDFKNDLHGFTNIFTDRLYLHASIEAARIQANLSPVYLYYNDYITVRNTIGIGTTHGEELSLLFSPANLTAPIIDQGHPDYEQSKAMVDLWIQFVTDPNNVTYNNDLWRPVESLEDSPNCFLFANSDRGEQGVKNMPVEILNRVKFWNEHGVTPYQEYAKTITLLID